MHNSVSTLIGKGLYDYAFAARIVGVKTRRLKRWIGISDNSSPVFSSDSPVSETVTFMELMELMFIGMFRKEGVPLQTIRQAAIAASIKFKTHHPFAVKRFDTDGKAIFATLRKKETDREVLEDLASGQLVFETIIKPFFHKIEYESTEVDDALRYWPFNRNGRVVLDPSRRLGQPIDAETGVPTSALAEAVEATGTRDVAQVAKWFDVPTSAVLAAVEFERSLTI
ncbi:MAG TPA: hypothetical protein VMM56_05370 [Planctomycetaceae bacterium]|nr:hypothetical protein [Planctomycetaceae bacterium]